MGGSQPEELVLLLLKREGGVQGMPGSLSVFQTDWVELCCPVGCSPAACDSGALEMWLLELGRVAGAGNTYDCRGEKMYIV